MAFLNFTGCTALSTAVSASAALGELDTYLSGLTPAGFTADERSRVQSYAVETTRKGWWNFTKGDLRIVAVQPTAPAGGGTYVAVYAMDAPPEIVGRVLAAVQGLGFQP